jgi:ADP-ribose pyrophosphatase
VRELIEHLLSKNCPELYAIKLEEHVSSKRLYEGRILNLRVDQVKVQNGKLANREIVEHRGAAAIVPILEGNSVILVRQYRYAVSTELLEIPAGTLEPNENPEKCARRELEEETGYKCREITKILECFVAPGYSTEKIHIYLAKGLTKTETKMEDDENIIVESFSLEAALDKIRSGEIQDAKTIAGLQGAAQLL